MGSPMLITGATGNVGAPLVRALRGAGVEVRPASRNNSDPGGMSFDFTDPTTWKPAFSGVRSMFVVRPPQITDVRHAMVPALEAARSYGVRRVVLLSVQGAGQVPVLPHARLERWLAQSGMSWTFLRPAYFDQNLTTVLAADIRDRNQIVVPAGKGRIAFVDAHDVAAVAAAALLDPLRHTSRIWTPTSEEALGYEEVATVLSQALGRTITYRRPSIPGYARHARTVLGFDPAITAVTTLIHATVRLGVAAGLTDDVRTVTGRAPTTLVQFAARERAVWEPRLPQEAPPGKGGMP